MSGVGFEVRSERGEIVAAVARVIARHGYERTTVVAIAHEAGTTAAAVRRAVGEKDDCVFALFSMTFHQAFAHVLESMRDVPWPQSVRDGLACLLDLLAAEPDYVRANVEGIRALGADGGLRLDAAVEAFTAFLAPGYETSAHRTPPLPLPVFHGHLIGSTVVHVISQHVLEDRIEELPQALPQLLGVALTPFCTASDIDALLTAS
ncbi:MAG TPA: helix-turn-helix domain-containing protein [Baekduia sp.]|uniref:TetR/AcrR family transcriptional regulator n=1 Tax=Baekduia sp. TaxID=2600305 RepID=UPI002BBC4383|nr:helix-turn-helix domain-containing protein [Baekduia sp.]HMJ36996.1 helix-turn-helix domain-containing protein [Baekduia sp.]